MPPYHPPPEDLPKLVSTACQKFNSAPTEELSRHLEELLPFGGDGLKDTFWPELNNDMPLGGNGVKNPFSPGLPNLKCATPSFDLAGPRGSVNVLDTVTTLGVLQICDALATVRFDWGYLTATSWTICC